MAKKTKAKVKTKRLNKDVPAFKQVWEHYKTGVQLLILNIKNETALCALIVRGEVTKLRVIVPVSNFMFWGNRGMFLVAKHTGRMPTKGKNAGVYNTRNVNLGAK